jgi:hypothetical protein
MNLKTDYLDLELRTPSVPSASPFSESFDNIKQMEDAGVAAIVLHSLFKKQPDQSCPYTNTSAASAIRNLAKC